MVPKEARLLTPKCAGVSLPSSLLVPPITVRLELAEADQSKRKAAPSLRFSCVNKRVSLRRELIRVADHPFRHYFSQSRQNIYAMVIEPLSNLPECSSQSSALRCDADNESPPVLVASGCCVSALPPLAQGRYPITGGDFTGALLLSVPSQPADEQFGVVRPRTALVVRQ